MSDTAGISFPSRRGLTRREILHRPEPSADRQICVLLLSPGIKGRVGPHRLYLKLAAYLVPLGYHILRFDFHGLGDSDGELPEQELVDVYNRVHGGRYVEDTIDAMDWLEATCGIRRFVGSGLCGGSISALLTAEIDHRIECLLGIGLPTILEGGPENWARYVTREQASLLGGAYLRKLGDPKSVIRFLSGKSSYGSILRILRRWLPVRAASSKIGTAATASSVDSTNPRFASAFLSMIDSGRPMLLVYSEADRLRAQFAENFELHYADRLKRLRDPYEVVVIPRANHVLSDTASVAELAATGVRWLQTLHGQFPQNHPMSRSPEAQS